MQSTPFPPLPPQSTAPIPYPGILSLILIYVFLLHLIADLIDEDETEALYSDPSSLGISPQDLKALPWFDFEGNTTANCVICLDWFQKGDRCRSLPVCNHTFHAPCTDLWLLKRLTCPACRSPFTNKEKEGLEVV